MALTAQISVMVEPWMREAIDRLQHGYGLKHGDAVREVLRAGLPVAAEALERERKLATGAVAVND